MTEQIKERMTAAEFLALPETMQKQELIEGELVVSPSPIPQHQRVSGRLFLLVNSAKTNGEAFYSPADVYLDEETVTQPDVFWIAEDGKCVETAKNFKGAPDLVVEILSPSTSLYDKREKFNAYEKHGVREYWLVDLEGSFVEVWVLKDGKFDRLGVFAKADTFQSAALGKEISLESIF